MKKSTFVLLLTFAVCSIGIVYLIFRVTDRNFEGNGFVRDVSHVLPNPLDTLDLKFNSFYFAGNTDHTLFLGNIVAPRKMIAVNMHTLDTIHVDIQINNPARLLFNSVKLTVDSPYFHLIDGSVPAILSGDLHDPVANQSLLEKVFFLDLIQTSPGSFLITTLDQSKERKLALLTKSPFNVTVASDLLQKQVDGLFCTHGMMHFDRRSERFVYLYSYRNEYLVTNSSLHLLCSGRTIDTTHTARLEVATIQSINARTFSSPPKVVNRQSALDGALLFVNSTLIGDNESYEDFSEVSVIDIYDIDKNRYLKSIYVPDNDGVKLRYFIVSGNRLFVLYRNELIAYDLSGLDIEPQEASENILHVKPG